MPTYLTSPTNKIIIGAATEFENIVVSAIVTRVENGFDTATIELPDNNSAFYPDTITNDTAIQLTVKEAGGSYPSLPMLKGVVRFPILPLNSSELIQLKCDGAGYGLGDTLCAQEYGTQSSNPTIDAMDEILTDANKGILTKYVNKILGSATASGFNYTNIGTINTSIPYLYFPYKPCNKAIDDLCDLVTALRSGSSGPHFIVTTDDKFHFKFVDATQIGWTQYYGDSQAASTLEQGVDFTDFRFEPIGPEANYIIYNGTWRRPSSGDFCEGNASDFGTTGGTYTWSDDATNHMVGAYGVKCANSILGGVGFQYPITHDAAWDFSAFTEYNTPNINLYLFISRLMNTSGGASPSFYISLNSASGYYYTQPGETIIDTVDTFKHFSYPIGPRSGSQNFQWKTYNTPDWSCINYVDIYIPFNDAGHAVLDGLHFGSSQITRIAQNSTNIAAYKVKMKTITDTIGKDDTLTAGTVGTTDTGLMAQMAYSELLRLQKSSIVGSVTIPMIPDALPGQWFHIHAKKKTNGTFTLNKDCRATKVTHVIGPTGYFTTLELTDDLTNSHPRPVYEDRNKIVAAQRPDYQDRQASSIKAGNIDIRIAPLVEDYPS